jgi:hypothetical protein
MHEDYIGQLWQIENIPNLRNDLLYYIRQRELYG